jgi:hypothetical protein
VVVAGLRSEGERSRVSSAVLDGAYLYWLQQDIRRKQFFVGRQRVADRRSPLEYSDRTLPGRVDSIAVTRGILFYTNGRGLFRADPAPSFSPRD